MAWTDEWGRSWQGPFSFTLTGVTAAAPQRPGVYQVGVADPAAGFKALYTGKADKLTIQARLKDHVTGRGSKHLGPNMSPPHLFVYWECDGKTAAGVESYIIVEKKAVRPYNDRNEFKPYIPNITVQ